MHLGHHSLKSIILFKHSLRIGADPSMQIFWISVTVAASDTFLMFSTIPFFIVPRTQTTTGNTTVFICHILCISSSRSSYLLFFCFYLMEQSSDMTGNQFVGGIHWIFGDDVWSVRCYSSVGIDWYAQQNGYVVVVIVFLDHVGIICLYLYIMMIFTDAPMEICCSIFSLGVYSVLANTLHMVHCLFILRKHSSFAPFVSPFRLLDNHLVVVVTVLTWGFSRIIGNWPWNALQLFFHFFFVNFILDLNTCSRALAFHFLRLIHLLRSQTLPLILPVWTS